MEILKYTKNSLHRLWSIRQLDFMFIKISVGDKKIKKYKSIWSKWFDKHQNNGEWCWWIIESVLENKINKNAFNCKNQN